MFPPTACIKKRERNSIPRRSRVRRKKRAKELAWRNALLTEISLVMADCTLSGMMVNFMCQLSWAMGCPDIWSNIILSDSNSWIGRLSKAEFPCPREGLIQSAEYPGLILLVAKGWSTSTRGYSRLPTFELRYQHFLAFRLTEPSALSGSQACQYSDWNATLSLPGSPAW